MHFRCVFTLLLCCMLIGLDWAEPIVRLNFINHLVWLYSMPNLLVFPQLVTLYLGRNHVRVVNEIVWRIAQDCAKKQGLVAGSHGWLAACKSTECCTHAKHARSWRVAPAVALQDKSPRLAKPFARDLNSQLNLVARSSRQNTLFGKN